MKHSTFLKVLEENESMDLTFEFENKQIQSDYHITEVLSTSVAAIDCGKRVSKWEESVVQLLEPKKEASSRFMSVKKALGIFKKSAELISISPEANVVLEFRPKSASAAQRYNVAEVSVKGGKLVVSSEGATTQCKPAKKAGSGCCG